MTWKKITNFLCLNVIISSLFLKPKKKREKKEDITITSVTNEADKKVSLSISTYVSLESFRRVCFVGMLHVLSEPDSSFGNYGTIGF